MKTYSIFLVGLFFSLWTIVFYAITKGSEKVEYVDEDHLHQDYVSHLKTLVGRVYPLDDIDKDFSEFVLLLFQIRSAQESDSLEARDVLEYSREGFQDECLKIVKNSQTSGTFLSQIAQDWLFYMNVYKNSGKKGFYVDVGANKPKLISNTWFFDRCLGWNGICIEGDPTMAEELRNERSCTVVQKCVSDKKESVEFVLNGVGSHVATEETNPSKETVKVECDTLESILDENKVEKIDFLTMDIEASEYKAMKDFHLRKYNTDFFVVESVHTELELDRVVHSQGYWKITDLSIDDLYVRGIPFKTSRIIDLERGETGIKYRRSVEKKNRRCARSMTKWDE